MDTTSIDVRAANAAAVHLPARPRTTVARLLRRLLGVTGLACGIWLLAMLFGSTSASAHTVDHPKVEHPVVTSAGSLLGDLTKPVDGLVRHVVHHVTTAPAQHASGGAGARPASPNGSSTDPIGQVVHVVTHVTRSVVSTATASVSRVATEVVRPLIRDVVRPLVRDVVSTITAPVQIVTGGLGSVPAPISSTSGAGVVATSTVVLGLLTPGRAEANATTDVAPTAHTARTTVDIWNSNSNSKSKSKSASTSTSTRPAARTTQRNSARRALDPTQPTAPRPLCPGGDQGGTTTSGAGAPTGSQFATSAQGTLMPRGTDGGRRRLPTTAGLVGVAQPRPTSSPD